MKLLATCAFGVESILKREMQDLGFEIVKSEQGKQYFNGTEETLIKANLWLRTAERIFIVLGEKKVLSYDELFDFIKGLNLKAFLGENGKYHLFAKSVKSKLFSPRDLQSISKKAIIENLKIAYQKDIFLEEKEKYRIHIDLENDRASLLLDTTGDSLHKRGYRQKQGEAPIKETLAATLIMLTFFDKNRTMYDPFCGSGTIAIEAAMIAKNIAPSLNRRFDFNDFHWTDKKLYKSLRKNALESIDHDVKTKIYASDNDLEMIQIAQENALDAGVDDLILFNHVDFEDMLFEEEYAIIVTNPPYGERLKTAEEAEVLYHEMARKFNKLQDYSIYIISSYPGIEGIFKRKANKTRVFFNGNIKSRFYQFFGPKPQ